MSGEHGNSGKDDDIIHVGGRFEDLASIAATTDASKPDVSMSAVNARLRQFIAEFRARPEGEPHPFRESDVLLAAMAEDALEAQARAALAQAETQRRLAEAKADGWRMRGGRMQ